MMSAFIETFLANKNQDSLHLVLSFLSCESLGRASAVCKDLNRVIAYGTNENLNAIWDSAASSLDQMDSTRFQNSREKCRLYKLASRFADKCCEEGETPPRMSVDGILANFMNVRGYDPESVANMVAAGKQENLSIEDMALASRITVRDISENELIVLIERQEGEEVVEEPLPDREYHHEIFVRVRRKETREVVIQGFSPYHQLYDGRVEVGNQQLLIPLCMQSMRLLDTSEFKDFGQSISAESGGFSGHARIQRDLEYTVIAMDKRTSKTFCIFQSDEYANNMRVPTILSAPGSLTYPIAPRWEEIVQFGTNIFSRYYFLTSIGIRKSGNIFPIIMISVKKDLSFFRHMLVAAIETIDE